MSEPQRAAPRVLVATVMPVHNRSMEELAVGVVEEIRAAGLTFVRSVVVKGEPQYIQQLVSNVSTDNEADAIVLVGGVGIGPRDHTCEALEHVYERRIEGFGEAWRRLLAQEFEGGPKVVLSRGTAGVYNQCVIFALGGPLAVVRKAIRELIAPVVAEAVELANGRGRSHAGR